LHFWQGFFKYFFVFREKSQNPAGGTLIFPAFCENIRFTFSGKFVIIGKMLVECPLRPLKGEVAAGWRGGNTV
jgi:hypothetical protein